VPRARPARIELEAPRPFHLPVVPSFASTRATTTGWLSSPSAVLSEPPIEHAGDTSDRRLQPTSVVVKDEHPRLVTLPDALREDEPPYAPANRPKSRSIGSLRRAGLGRGWRSLPPSPGSRRASDAPSPRRVAGPFGPALGSTEIPSTAAPVKARRLPGSGTPSLAEASEEVARRRALARAPPHGRSSLRLSPPLDGAPLRASALASRRQAPPDELCNMSRPADTTRELPSSHPGGMASGARSGERRSGRGRRLEAHPASGRGSPHRRTSGTFVVRRRRRGMGSTRRSTRRTEAPLPGALREEDRRSTRPGAFHQRATGRFLDFEP
jgi:hypothetical protein